NFTLPRLSSRLAANHQEKATCGDGGDADPHGHIDRLLLLNRQLKRSQFHGGRVFRVTETTVGQAENPTDDEQDGDKFEGVQCAVSLNWVLHARMRVKPYLDLPLDDALSTNVIFSKTL